MPFASLFSKRNLFLISIYYLYIPFAIFLCFWVKLWLGLPLALLLGIVPFFLMRNLKGSVVHGKRFQEVLIFLIILFVIVLSGVGGYVWQNRWDHLFRNAIFFDLVNNSWPVSNDSSILVYYIGFWLPAAALSKLTGSIEIGWFIQLIYGFIGLLLSFRLMLEIIGNFRLRYILPFIFFSGADIVYYIISGDSIRNDWHIELWSDLTAWESNITLFNWVYNQAIPSFVGTMLILRFGKNIGVAAITLCFLLISAPFSVIGLLPLSIYYIINGAIIHKTIAYIFNYFNIISLIGALPIGLYLLLNPSTVFQFGIGQMDFFYWFKQLFLVLTLEILLFIPFVYKYISKRPEFYILFFTSFLCLFFQMDNHYGDFNWRIEIPLNFYMTLMIAIFIGNWEKISKFYKVSFLIISLFTTITPLFEYYRITSNTLRRPASEYRSFYYSSIFETMDLRENFVNDSILYDNSKSKLLLFFNYELPPLNEPRKEQVQQ